MSKCSIVTACFIATLAASSAPAQLRGTVSGVVGGLRNTVTSLGNTVGSTVGGPIGGTVSGVTGAVGGTLGGVGTSVDSGLGRLSRPRGTSGSGGFTLTGTRLNQPSEDEGSSVEPISLDDVTGYLDGQLATPNQIENMRKARLRELIRANRDVLDRDDRGQPVRRSELIACDPDTPSILAAQRAGFRVVGYEPPSLLGVRIVRLALPRGINVRQGLKALRRAAPSLQADYNHVYEPAGGALLPALGASLAMRATVRPGTRIAMIDGGVASHPSLAAASIEQRGFVGDPQPTGHGTAVGSLLVGSQGAFRGAARGAQLFVADVYGGNPAAGSATAIVQALAWAASKRPAVINISLVGPPNRTMQRAIDAVRARGIAVVASVGNDGPAAPPQYPASYPGVIAVTGVDGADRALIEAGQSAHLDFAAPGADLVAALPGSGYTPVRGTSFAAPFVAARLAATGSTARLAAEAMPGTGKVGRGIVCRSCRILPKTVGLNFK